MGGCNSFDLSCNIRYLQYRVGYMYCCKIIIMRTIRVYCAFVKKWQVFEFDSGSGQIVMFGHILSLAVLYSLIGTWRLFILRQSSQKKQNTEGGPLLSVHQRKGTTLGSTHSEIN